MNPIREDNSSPGAVPLDRQGKEDPEDARLLAAVQEYMRALETGHRPNRREFLARYPDIADELSECLDGLAFVHSAAVEIPGAAAPPRAPKEPHSDIDIENARPLGDFRLIREIGRGGMGIVYEAIQLTLGRKVAVKVLPMAAALDARHLERFRNEAQAAAQLHHTNIVPVYAVGCERSVHFYAMQLIEGQSLSEVIRDLRQLATPASDASKYDLQADPHDALTLTWRPGSSASATPTKNPKPPEAAPRPPIDRSLSHSNFSPQSLSTLRNTKGAAYARSVANLGLQVAQALDYAHRAGVVHRDIKPANLLLDAKGTLWITDFGLAQFYTDNNLTRSGDMVGTMRYMSPEQASGRAVVLDQRTDIYSLGVTLYELLTLERALPGTTHAQLLDQLANHDPRPARAVDKTIPRELEIILAKAMAKDPADRYQSADLLAADLQRFLTDQPIHARPPSLWDKSVKWTRRHRSLALSTLVTLAIIAIGLLISTLLIAREQGRTKSAYQLEAQKAIEANQQRARAEKSSRQARDAVDFFSRIAQSINDPKFDDVRREMLEESLNYYQSFLEDRSDNQAVNAELDAAKARVSNLLSRLLAIDASLRAASRVHLVTYPAVQEDLKLTPAEIKAANELANEFDRKRDDEFLEMSQLPPQERRQHLPAGATEIETKLNQLLGDRAERLRQIQRQDRGPLAFSDADVVEKLALTRDQRAKIRTLQSDFREARFGPGHWQESFDDLRNRAAATVDNILTKLTDSQRQTWQELIGPKVAGKLPMNSLFGPRGFGRGGPDGGRGGPDAGGGPGGRGPGRGGPPDGGQDKGPGHPGGFDQSPRRGI